MSVKGSSFKSIFSFDTVFYLKGSFLAFFASLGATGGKVTGCSASKLSCFSVSDSGSD